mgnify:CR=1 FL=1
MIFRARDCCAVSITHRDISLGGALGDRADIDVMPAKRAEHFARDTGMAFHLIPDDRDDCLVRFFVERR